MDSLTSQEAWEAYQSGNFNSVKHKAGMDVSLIEEAGRMKILQYTVDAAIKRPGLAWKAFCLLTRLVWEVDGGGGWSISPYIAANSYALSTT